MKKLLNNFLIKTIIINTVLFLVFLFFIFSDTDAFSLEVFAFIIFTGFITAIILFNKEKKEKMEIVFFSSILFYLFLWLVLLNKDFLYKDYSLISSLSLNQDMGDLKASIFFIGFPIIFYFLGFLLGVVLKERILKTSRK